MVITATAEAVSTAAAEAVSTAAAEAAEMASSAGAGHPVPPEGGTGGAETSRRDEASPEGEAAGRNDEIARLKREMVEMSLRLEIREEERTRMERLQQGAGGDMRPREPHGQPGTFLVGFGKPSPKLDSNKEDTYFKWLKKFLSWAVTNTCDDGLKENSDPIVLQGPNRRSQQDLEYRFGTATVAAARRAHEGIANALTNSSLLYKIHDIGSPSLAMAEVRRHHVPSDEIGKQAYQRQ